MLVDRQPIRPGRPSKLSFASNKAPLDISNMRWNLIFGVAFISLAHLVVGETIDVPIPCKLNSDCTIPKLPKDAFCKHGYCICPQGNKEKNCSSSEIVQNDKKGPLVSRTCKHDQDCKLFKGFCNTTRSQCECQKGYVPSKNKQQCLEKARSIGFACIDDNQCLAFLPNTTCRSGHCNCDTGYHYLDNACWKIAGYKNPCTKDQECSDIAGAVCTEKRECECKAETVISVDRRRCLSVAKKFMDECMENLQCSMTFKEALCIEKKCQCRQHYHFELEMTRCFINRGLGEECGNSYECYQVGSENSTLPGKPVECLSNKCVCASNYHKQGDKCVSEASTFARASVLVVLLTTLICRFSI